MLNHLTFQSLYNIRFRLDPYVRAQRLTGHTEMFRPCVVIALIFSCLSAIILVEGSVIQRRGPLKSKVQFKEDDLQLLEPAIVPDPAPGGSWWYAPSRRSSGYAKKYENRVNKMLVSKATDDEFRLPGDLRPTVQVIKLIPHLEEDNFITEGYTEIFVDCIEPTKIIVLNSVNLTMDRNSVAVWNMDTNSPMALRDFTNEQNTTGMITITTAEQLLPSNKYKITIKYTSVLNNLSRGFYRSSYVENGVTKWLAVSDFESSDARQAFPCFDEPNFKAKFSVFLGRKTEMTSASNMPQIGSEPIEGMPGYQWDIYQTSPEMSTYLVAFLVSEYIDVQSNPALSNTQVRVWARPEAENLTKYAADIGPRIIEFYESYLGINYSLPKEDFAAVPDKDFTAGAMENWGLITYRESDLLIDTDTASESLKQRVAVVSAHELAHQWFGDLVTLDWWNAVWLNEGFATYYEYIGTDAVEKGFKMFDQFGVSDLQYVFISDSLETSRPLHTEVSNPADIGRFFDAISYSKGGSVIRMMSDILGIDTLNRGLTRYLTNEAFGNGEEDELWEALQKQADEDQVVLPAKVKEIMDTWVLQMGYPVITVERNLNDGTVNFSQERFLSRKSGNSGDDHDYKWWVPLTIKTGANPQVKTIDWLSTEDVEKTISLPAFGVPLRYQYVLLNIDQQNYYRVQYDKINYDLLTQELKAQHEQFSADIRAQLLDDSFNLALAGRIPYEWALELSQYLANERKWAPWNSVLTELNYIDNMLHNRQEYADLKVYLTSLVAPYYYSVGFEARPETDTHLNIYSRTDASNWACRLVIADCVNNAKTQYENLMNNPNLVLNPNQRSLILRTGVQNGLQAEWDFAFEQYQATGDTAFLVAMANTKQADLIYMMMNMIVNPESGIYEGNLNTLFSNIAANPLGNSIAMDFLINHWNEFVSFPGPSYCVTFFRYLCDRANTQDQLDKMTTLLKDHPEILGDSPTVQQGLDVITSNIEWMELHLAEIGLWLKLNPPLFSVEPPTTEGTTSTIQVTSPTTTTETSTLSTSTTSVTTSATTTTTEATTTTDGGNSIHAAPLLLILSLIRFIIQ